MPTPPKPFSVLKSEGKSHRTKKELKLREQGEKALSTGTALKARNEVKKNKIANKEFKRINELLKKIEKNDAIYEAVINRYCLIYAETMEFEEKKNKLYELVEKLENQFEESIEYLEKEELAKETRKFTRAISDLVASIVDLDKQLQPKRKMLLDIEKENIMTIASALRVIPKKPENDSAKETILKVLNGNS
ncbi:MAG: hypothetical protein E6X14_08060 [Clostridium celatum]|jgi:predicted nuclease with TOPRIM domain|uniref:hypothetical protein n=1 Tax=uncultured Clostridium sp. TaxID=59620 RepID=UPI00082035A0|nr:hypothetical protein [uncultured Clostridium sp.]MDU4979391.1 hypothetical protein [Clostridium celatum]SCJ83315.1 Phage terminase%2C small subunit [uncultured Clostridium sp.]